MAAAPRPDDPNAPPELLYQAVQEQLGLKLEPQKVPATQVLVIDHAEQLRRSGN